MASITDNQLVSEPVYHCRIVEYFTATSKSNDRIRQPHEITEAPMTDPYTKEEMRQMFLDHCQTIAFYWSHLEYKTPRERCDGVVFSMLNIFDGCSGGSLVLSIW